MDDCVKRKTFSCFSYLGPFHLLRKLSSVMKWANISVKLSWNNGLACLLELIWGSKVNICAFLWFCYFWIRRFLIVIDEFVAHPRPVFTLAVVEIWCQFICFELESSLHNMVHRWVTSLLYFPIKMQSPFQDPSAILVSNFHGVIGAFSYGVISFCRLSWN